MLMSALTDALALARARHMTGRGHCGQTFRVRLEARLASCDQSRQIAREFQPGKTARRSTAKTVKARHDHHIHSIHFDRGSTPL